MKSIVIEKVETTEREELNAETVFAYLKRPTDLVSETVIAAEIGIDVPAARQYLKELGVRVECDSDGNWRLTEKNGQAFYPERLTPRTLKLLSTVATREKTSPTGCLAIEVLTNSAVISSELLAVEVMPEEEEEKDRQEAIKLKAEIINLITDWFIQLGEKLKYYQEKKLYRFEAENFGVWCEQEVGIKKAYAYRLIAAYEIYQHVAQSSQKQVSPTGRLNIPLPTSERQLKPLTKLPEEQWFSTWCEAVERNGRNDRAPAGKIVEQIVQEKKAMATAYRYQSELERFNQGEIVRITAKHHPDLKKYHRYWAIVEQVDELGYTLHTYKGYLKGVVHNNLRLIKQASLPATEMLLDKMKKSLLQDGSDSGCSAFLHYLATKPVPDVSMWENEVLNLSAN